MKDDATVGKGGDATHGVAPCRNARGGVMGARHRAFVAGGIGCCVPGAAWGALAEAPAAETVTSGGGACSGNGATLPDESAPT